MYKLAILFALFPYISPIQIPMDTAPYAHIFMAISLFIILYKYSVYGTYEKIISIISVYNTLLFILSLYFVFVMLFRLVIFKDMSSVRVFGNYGAICMFIMFFLLFSIQDDTIKEKFIKTVSSYIYVSSFLYLAASLMQLASRVTGFEIFFDIVNMVVSSDISGRSSTSRGMNSIAAEPSYAGIQTSLMACIVMLLYHMQFMSRARMLKSGAALLLTAVLSASATAIPFILIAIYAVSTSWRRSTKIIGVLGGGIIAVGLITTLESVDGIRLFSLMELLFSGGVIALLSDVSFASRFASPINYSLPLFVDGAIFGNPFSQFGVDIFSRHIENSIFPDYIKNALYIGLVAEGGGLVTKSGIAQSIFLFGIPAIIFWLLFLFRGAQYRAWTLSRKEIRHIRSVRRCIVMMIFLGYLIQVPLGHPTFLLSWGILLLTRTEWYPSVSLGADGAGRASSTGIRSTLR